ncbi:MAG: membrane protein insertase YidC [Candidatus Neomarinimicrobiota bacterium]|tara:strand:- start:41 stop:1711 length:1671 start_codon:yes stop_codon:yes gene_type:complete
MMDRNTLTALLLITLVLIITPYYMELVSPPTPVVDEVVSGEEDNQAIEYREYERNSGGQKDIITQPKETKEKIIKIENELYIATISSLCGGSIKSFEVKEHLKYDSSFVNLITSSNEKNLLISFKDFNGNQIDLDNGWSLQSNTNSFYIDETKSITYTNVLDGKKITKVLTFYPYRFLIDIDVDITSLSNNTLANNYTISWFGGIPPTEKDSVTESTYFYSYLYQGGELLDVKVGQGEEFSNDYKGQTDWVATRSKYFVTCLLDDSGEQFDGSKISASYKDKEIYDLSVTLQSNKVATISLYLGPLEYERIKNLNVNLEAVMDFGWAIIRPISKSVLWVLKTMNKVIPNYGIILVIFSILVKLIVYPLTKRSYQSTQAMQAIQPEINALREKHKNNPTKLNTATMELYKKKGVNPLGTCFPMLLQMPLLFALFTVFRSTIELRGEPFVFWIKDLSAPDVIFYLPFKVPLYGDYVCALPILMALSMFAQQKMMQPVAATGPQADQQKMMQYFMMGFFFLLFNSFPSGLNLYYTLFNVLTIAQQKLTTNAQANTGLIT